MEPFFAYVVLPLLIFLSRVIDVSLGTVRIIFISKGFKLLSLVIGFFEVLVWIIALNQIWSNINNIWLYISYAGGFAMGTYLGICLDEKISLGKVMVRVIVRKNAQKLIKKLKEKDYRITILKGKGGRDGKEVDVIFSVVERKKLKRILQIIKENNPGAFYTIEDIRNAKEEEYLISSRRKRRWRKKVQVRK